MAKIGVFGGSFNPPHLGHILAACEFQRKLSLDRVLLIPAAVPPHKTLTGNSPSPKQRLEMTRLAAREICGGEASELELSRTGVSYTADTLDSLRERFANDELYLLMGTDMFESFSQWYHPERIVRQAKLVVAHRSRDDANALMALAHELTKSLGAEIILLENDYLPVSSSSARAMLAFGCGEDYLCASVLDYVRKNGLYYTGANLHALDDEALCRVSLSLHLNKRVPHVKGCSETAAQLARHYGANETDARRAGLLHDITKLLSGDEQLKLCEKYAMIISDLERKNPKLLHAKTGAEVAGRIFGENDAVCEAIRWHTTGRRDMSLLEKIIYLADYMEPNRAFDGVEELRRLALCDLDGALALGLQMTVDQLAARKLEINENSLAALRFLQERK